MLPPHVVLLGDSILDNRSYTRGEPDVVSHLRALLPPGGRATLAAVDGATAGDVKRQLARVPDDATHVVLSVGGNDALMNHDLLETPVSSTTEALDLFAERTRAFEAAYRRAVEAVVRLGRPTTLCTIYNGNLPGVEGRVAPAALVFFNDAILRTAIDYGAGAIELRLVCTERADYANPIEPSGLGGRKIAEAIVRAIAPAGDGRGRTVVTGGRAR